MRIIIECPENILHLEAEYICADCPFAQLQTSCSPATDHTFSPVIVPRCPVVVLDVLIRPETSDDYGAIRG